MTRQEWIVHALACSGNLFLLVTLPELRRRRLTYLAFYALQRAVQEADQHGAGWTGGYSEFSMRRETGLPDYETSRACALLAKRGLVIVSKSDEDRRVRLLRTTEVGIRTLGEILSAAGRRLWEGIPARGRIRRVKETTEALGQANRLLLGTFQLSFFDKDLYADEPARKRTRKRTHRPDRT